MADIKIEITIPDAYSARFIDAVDLIWEGRELQDPVPTKAEWVKHHIKENLKQQVLMVERELVIDEIEIN